jgi:hypothetical protein
MTDRSTAPLAAALTARLLEIDGVVQVFPLHPIATALRAVTDGAQELVEVRADAAGLAVSARIGIARTAPTAAVVDRVVAALTDVRERGPVRLSLEIAYIE